MKDYDNQIRQLKEFIDDRIIVTKDSNDYILVSDLHFFINENRDYKDVINHWAISKTLKDYKGIKKKSFQGTMNIIGFKWKPTI